MSRRTRRRPPLTQTRVAALRSQLDAVLRSTDRQARLAADPVSFVHRYSDPADQEVAAVFASVLAYGRVAAFRPVIRAVLEVADGHGGPRAWVEAAENPDLLVSLAPLRYRWMQGTELASLARGVGRVVRDHGGLEPVFQGGRARGDDLGAGIVALRRAVMAGEGTDDWTALPRGLRYMLPHPASGSACKRWCMFMRWMVRPPHPGPDGIDLGIWSRSTSRLVIPLDTHVLRLSRFLRLTARRDGSWRTALQVTDALARIAPDDPLRYDFALAHLGISGLCKGGFHADVCPSCDLRAVCGEVPKKLRSTG